MAVPIQLAQTSCQPSISAAYLSDSCTEQPGGFTHLAYPLAGWLGARLGFGIALSALSAMAALGGVVAWRTWPRQDPDVLAHHHDDLSTDHPHWNEYAFGGGNRTHTHRFVIDELHQRWPH